MTFSKSKPVFKTKSSTDSEVTFKSRPKMFDSSGRIKKILIILLITN